VKIGSDIWKKLSLLLKARLLSKYDPGTLVPEDEGIKQKLEIPHHGVYITVYDSRGKSLSRAGFLKDGSTNVLDSAMSSLNGVYTELESKGIPHKKLLTSSYNFAVIWDLLFIENSLAWDVNEDGIYFSWGDRYKGMYLPHDIKQMSVTRAEILNRLCSWEIGLPSNLWRLPEGLSYRMLCDSHSI
jgi:hypothetical protein